MKKPLILALVVLAVCTGIILAPALCRLIILLAKLINALAGL